MQLPLAFLERPDVTLTNGLTDLVIGLEQNSGFGRRHWWREQVSLHLHTAAIPHPYYDHGSISRNSAFMPK